MSFLQRWFKRVVGKSPEKDAELQRAHALFDAGQFDAAAAAYAALIELQPSPGLHVNRAYSLWMAGRPGAEAGFRCAIELTEDFAQAWTGLGDMAAAQGDHASAVGHYERAIRSEPQLAVAHNNFSQSLHALGRLEEAWRESEWRFAAPGAQALYPHTLALPRWDGSSPRGRLLVHWEQGFGDMLQHLRFLPLLEARRIDFVFECPPPLARLVTRALGSGRVCVASDAAPDVAGFAAACGLLSLPHVLGVTAQTLPSPPYLEADPAEGWRMLDRAGINVEAETGVRIGVVWRGSNFDPARNACLEDFSALGSTGARLVSLQKDLTTGESTLLAEMGGIDASALLSDFAATADIVAGLDRVFSVDTAVAHLAGALGKPVELLLNEHPAVRWGAAGEETPWYPSMRLLRRHPGSSWSDLVGVAASRRQADSAV